MEKKKNLAHFITFDSMKIYFVNLAKTILLPLAFVSSFFFRTNEYTKYIKVRPKKNIYDDW